MRGIHIEVSIINYTEVLFGCNELTNWNGLENNYRWKVGWLPDLDQTGIEAIHMLNICKSEYCGRPEVGIKKQKQISKLATLHGSSYLHEDDEDKNVSYDFAS